MREAVEQPGASSCHQIRPAAPALRERRSRVVVADSPVFQRFPMQGPWPIPSRSFGAGLPTAALTLEKTRPNLAPRTRNFSTGLSTIAPTPPNIRPSPCDSPNKPKCNRLGAVTVMRRGIGTVRRWVLLIDGPYHTAIVALTAIG